MGLAVDVDRVPVVRVDIVQGDRLGVDIVRVDFILGPQHILPEARTVSHV